MKKESFCTTLSMAMRATIVPAAQSIVGLFTQASGAGEKYWKPVLETVQKRS